MLGTNGGGFFGTNSAHPFENPTPLSNRLEMSAIFLIPAGLTVTLGQLTGSPRHGWAVFAAMSILWFAGVLTCYWAESQPNPLLHGVDQHVSVEQAGGNMEGKEVRIGIANSALFATVTTGASCGAVNAMHDSFMPLGGMVPMINILLGEIVFGGVGAGLHAPAHATVRCALGHHVQRADHHLVNSSRAARRKVSPFVCGGHAAAQSADLRCGQHHCAIHRH